LYFCTIQRDSSRSRNRDGGPRPGTVHIQSGLNTTTLLVPKKYVSISNFPVY